MYACSRIGSNHNFFHHFNRRCLSAKETSWSKLFQARVHRKSGLATQLENWAAAQKNLVGDAAKISASPKWPSSRFANSEWTRHANKCECVYKCALSIHLQVQVRPEKLSCVNKKWSQITLSLKGRASYFVNLCAPPAFRLAKICSRAPARPHLSFARVCSDRDCPR